jgi:hypothetical protein
MVAYTTNPYRWRDPISRIPTKKKHKTSWLTSSAVYYKRKCKN